MVSQDEAHFTQRSTVTARLVKRGSRPRVASYPGRAKVSFSGFVELGANNGRLFIDSPERFTWETTIASKRGYLATLGSADKRKIWMILDNAPWHRKAKRLIREEDEYRDLGERVSFLDIPPYSPDLNPIEQVWRVAKREVTHNRFFSSIDNERRELEAWTVAMVFMVSSFEKMELEKKLPAKSRTGGRRPARRGSCTGERGFF